MISWCQISEIKSLQAGGWRLSEIARHLGLDRKTVRKYMLQDDFSPKFPISVKRSSRLDPFKDLIVSWLKEGESREEKKRVTAQEVHDRLLREHDETYHCSYSTVRRFVHQCALQTATQNGGLQ